MKTNKKGLRKTIGTMTVFALVGVMGLSCLTGCTGNKKQNDVKPATNQTQQLNSEENQQSETETKAVDSKKTGSSKKIDSSKSINSSKKTDNSKKTGNSNTNKGSSAGVNGNSKKP